MEMSSFYDILLNLDDNWQVKKVSTDIRSGQVDIYVDYIGEQAEDPDSGDLCPIYDFRELRKWRHLDTLQYKTFIMCRVPRIKALDSKIKTIEVPWAGGFERFTYLFEAHVINLLQATRSQSQTAALVDCGFSVINRIMHRATQRGLARRPKSFPIHHISIDEKKFKKGHDYVTVLSHPHVGCVLDVVHGRDIQSCEALLSQTLTKEQQGQIKTITMDMWKPYMNVAQKVIPGAQIVHDKFHLVKYLTDSIDKVRRREVKTNEDLKHARYALLKNSMNLTDQQKIKFESIRNSNYEVAKAWTIRENFKSLFGERSQEEAFVLFSQWCEDALRKGIKEVNKVVKTFKNHLSGVVNALVIAFNNAMAERLNGKIQELKTIGRGYRKFENFRSAILFFYGELNLLPQKY